MKDLDSGRCLRRLRLHLRGKYPRHFLPARPRFCRIHFVVIVGLNEVPAKNYSPAFSLWALPTSLSPAKTGCDWEPKLSIQMFTTKTKTNPGVDHIQVYSHFALLLASHRHRVLNLRVFPELLDGRPDRLVRPQGDGRCIWFR